MRSYRSKRAKRNSSRINVVLKREPSLPKADITERKKGKFSILIMKPLPKTLDQMMNSTNQSNNALLNVQNSGPTNLNIVQDDTVELPTKKVKKIRARPRESELLTLPVARNKGKSENKRSKFASPEVSDTAASNKIITVQKLMSTQKMDREEGVTLMQGALNSGTLGESR